MEAQTIDEVHRQFDLAIRNCDLRAARRLAARMYELLYPGKPMEINRADHMIRGYVQAFPDLEIQCVDAPR